MADTGVQVRLAYARLTTEEAGRLLQFCANKSIGLPTQNLISTQTTNTVKDATQVNFSIDQPNIDMIAFTFPFSETALDYCPNPFLDTLSFRAQGRELGGQEWKSWRPSLLQQTGCAMTEPQSQGLNDELVSSYANPLTLVHDMTSITGPPWDSMIHTTNCYFGTDWLAAFDCQPTYSYMKGLNSEGTPKVMQFSANFSGSTPKEMDAPNYVSKCLTKYTGDTPTAYLTLLYDTIIGLTFNGAGYCQGSFEGLTTGALYSAPTAGITNASF
jgi:hypothetical protein